MAIYIYECGQGHVTERILPISQHRDAIRCPECKKTAKQVFKPTANAQLHKPIVVFQNAAGETCYPGDANDPVPAGYERRELRTIREIESFEREERRKGTAEHQRVIEAEEQYFGAIRDKERGDLRQAMQGWSPLMRDAARAAMEKTDNRRRRRAEGGVMVHILHFDQSNRAARER